jgi:hypothetical protein
MEILRLLDKAAWVEKYEVQDYRQWTGGVYYRLKIEFSNDTTLFVKEYVDEKERVYSFHWQTAEHELIIRWDNAPHHQHIATFPHHKHTAEGVSANSDITLAAVLAEIEAIIAPPTAPKEPHF